MAVFIRGLFLLFTIILFVFSESKETKKEGKIILRVIAPYKGTTIEAWLKKEATSFEKEHPNVSVVIEEYSEESYNQVLKRRLNEGDTDIFFSEARKALKMAGDKNLLLPLDSVANASDFVLLSGVYTPLFEYDENVYGIPFRLKPFGLFYKKTLLEKYHISLPRNFDQFLEVCNTLSEKGVTAFSVSGDGKMFSLLASYFVLREGGVSNYQDLLSGRISYSDEIVKEAIKAYQSLLTQKCVREDFMNRSTEEARLDFLQDKSLFLLDEEEVLRGFQDVNYFTFPSLHGIDGSRSVDVGEVFGLYALRRTKHTKEVGLFLKKIFSNIASLPASLLASQEGMRGEIKKLETNPFKREIISPLGSTFEEVNLDVYYKILKDVFNAKTPDEKKLLLLGGEEASESR